MGSRWFRNILGVVLGVNMMFGGPLSYSELIPDSVKTSTAPPILKGCKFVNGGLELLWQNKANSDTVRRYVAYLTTILANFYAPIWVNLGAHVEESEILSTPINKSYIGLELLKADIALKRIAKSVMANNEKFVEIFSSQPGGIYPRFWIEPEKMLGAVGDNSILVNSLYLKVKCDIESTLPRNLEKQVWDLFDKEIVPLIEREVNKNPSFYEIKNIVVLSVIALWYVKNKENLPRVPLLDEAFGTGVVSSKTTFSKRDFLDEFLKLLASDSYELSDIFLIGGGVFIPPSSRISYKVIEGPSTNTVYKNTVSFPLVEERTDIYTVDGKVVSIKDDNKLVIEPSNVEESLEVELLSESPDFSDFFNQRVRIRESWEKKYVDYEIRVRKYRGAYRKPIVMAEQKEGKKILTIFVSDRQKEIDRDLIQALVDIVGSDFVVKMINKNHVPKGSEKRRYFKIVKEIIGRPAIKGTSYLSNIGNSFKLEDVKRDSITVRDLGTGEIKKLPVEKADNSREMVASAVKYVWEYLDLGEGRLKEFISTLEKVTDDIEVYFTEGHFNDVFGMTLKGNKVVLSPVFLQEPGKLNEWGYIALFHEVLENLIANDKVDIEIKKDPKAKRYDVVLAFRDKGGGEKKFLLGSIGEENVKFWEGKNKDIYNLDNPHFRVILAQMTLLSIETNRSFSKFIEFFLDPNSTLIKGELREILNSLEDEGVEGFLGKVIKGLLGKEETIGKEKVTRDGETVIGWLNELLDILEKKYKKNYSEIKQVLDRIGRNYEKIEETKTVEGTKLLVLLDYLTTKNYINADPEIMSLAEQAREFVLGEIKDSRFIFYELWEQHKKFVGRNTICTFLDIGPGNKIIMTGKELYNFAKALVRSGKAKVRVYKKKGDVIAFRIPDKEGKPYIPDRIKGELGKIDNIARYETIRPGDYIILAMTEDGRPDFYLIPREKAVSIYEEIPATEWPEWLRGLNLEDRSLVRLRRKDTAKMIRVKLPQGKKLYVEKRWGTQEARNVFYIVLTEDEDGAYIIQEDINGLPINWVPVEEGYNKGHKQHKQETKRGGIVLFSDNIERRLSYMVVN